jgi:hypothetical protein
VPAPALRRGKSAEEERRGRSHRRYWTGRRPGSAMGAEVALTGGCTLRWRRAALMRKTTRAREWPARDGEVAVAATSGH